MVAGTDAAVDICRLVESSAIQLNPSQYWGDLSPNVGEYGNNRRRPTSFSVAFIQPTLHDLGLQCIPVLQRRSHFCRSGRSSSPKHACPTMQYCCKSGWIWLERSIFGFCIAIRNNNVIGHTNPQQGQLDSLHTANLSALLTALRLKDLRTRDTPFCCLISFSGELNASFCYLNFAFQRQRSALFIASITGGWDILLFFPWRICICLIPIYA